MLTDQVIISASIFAGFVLLSLSIRRGMNSFTKDLFRTVIELRETIRDAEKSVSPPQFQQKSGKGNASEDLQADIGALCRELQRFVQQIDLATLTGEKANGILFRSAEFDFWDEFIGERVVVRTGWNKGIERIQGVLVGSTSTSILVQIDDEGHSRYGEGVISVPWPRYGEGVVCIPWSSVIEMHIACVFSDFTDEGDNEEVVEDEK